MHDVVCRNERVLGTYRPPVTVHTTACSHTPQHSILTRESLVTARETQSMKPNELMWASSSSRLHAAVTTPCNTVHGSTSQHPETLHMIVHHNTLRHCTARHVHHTNPSSPVPPPQSHHTHTYKPCSFTHHNQPVSPGVYHWWAAQSWLHVGQWEWL